MDDALIWNELQRVAERMPGRIALQSSEPGAPRYSYREMIDRASAAGCAIARTGVRAGDRVALWSPVSPSWAIAYLGILASGGVVVPLDAGGSATDAAAVLRATDCSLLIGADDVLTANPVEHVADTSVPGDPARRVDRPGWSVLPDWYRSARRDATSAAAGKRHRHDHLYVRHDRSPARCGDFTRRRPRGGHRYASVHGAVTGR